MAEGIRAGSAFVDILPKVGSGFVSQLSRDLTGPIAAEGKKISTALSQSLTAGKVLAVGAFAAIGAAAFKGLGSAVSATEEFGSKVLALHRIIGGSVEDASKLEVVFEHFGVSSDGAARAVSLLEKNLVNGGKAVTQYGLSLTDANGKTLTGTQLLEEAANKYQSLGSAAEKTAFLLNVFGRSGRDMAVVMQGGAKAIEEAASAAEKYGLVLTGSNLEAIHKYALAQHDLGLASTGLKLSIGEVLIPVLTELTGVLTTGVEIFNEIPGPIKAVTLVTLGVGAAFVTVGLGLGILNKALLGYGLRLPWITKETIAQTVANEALAVSEGEVAAGGIAAGAGGVAAGAGAAAGAAGVARWLGLMVPFNPVLKLHLEYVKKVGGKYVDLGRAADGSVIPLSGLAFAFDTESHAAHAAANNTADLQTAIENLKNVPKLHGSQVVNDILKVGRNAQYASDNVQTLRGQLVQLPNGKIIEITLPRLAAVRASLRGLKSEVEAIAGTYGITYVIHTVGHAPVQRLAEGGVFRAAQGFTFMAGEANYPTPFGRGSEIVTPRGVEPLANDHLDRIGDRVAMRVREGGPTADAIGDAVARRMWELMRAGGGRREIALRASGRDLVATVRAQDLWDS